ncbi:MAG: hypothetical protein KF862_07445 [Chitinophagaceae bacterium]|nr:hypothetical protein [Chitinophagaceae bacterium]
MTCRLEIWLKDYYFTEELIQLPHDPLISFEENFNLRKMILDLAIRRMEVIYQKQIERCQGKYHFVMVFESRIFELEIIEDE